MRYFWAVVLCATSLLFVRFAVEAGSMASLLLGFSGLATAAGVIVRHDGVVRYLCAAILLANAVMFGVASSGALLSFAIAALSLAAAIGLVLRQQWVRIPTVIASVMTVGGWTAAAFGAALAHRWPDADVGTGVISLIPGALFLAVWIWCAFAVARIAEPSAAPA